MTPPSPVVELRAGSSRLVMDLQHGASITYLGTGGPNLLAEFGDPAGVVDDAASDGLRWLARYRGGWQEMFPNAGDACLVDGRSHGTHGDASLGEWRLVDRDERRGVVEYDDPSGLQLHRSVEIDERSGTFVIESIVHNAGDAPASFIWGHHPAFAASPGDRLDIQTTKVLAADPQPASSDGMAGAVGTWPEIAGSAGGSIDLATIPEAATERVCYLPEIERSRFVLHRPGVGCTIEMEWSADAFPHAWYWMNRKAERFPFEGRVTSVAIEPASTWPGSGLGDAIETGRASRLDPGDRRTGEVVVHVES